MCRAGESSHNVLRPRAGVRSQLRRSSQQKFSSERLQVLGLVTPPRHYIHICSNSLFSEFIRAPCLLRASQIDDDLGNTKVGRKRSRHPSPIDKERRFARFVFDKAKPSLYLCMRTKPKEPANQHCEKSTHMTASFGLVARGRGSLQGQAKARHTASETGDAGLGRGASFCDDGGVRVANTRFCIFGNRQVFTLD